MKNRIFFITAAFFLPFISKAQDGIKAGNFIIETATLISLGFEWNFTGDAIRNATVETTYRITGTKNWKEALPLLRIGGERVFRKVENVEYTVPDLFAGSILDIFTNMHAPNPATHHAVYHATDIYFTLNPKGKAVDKGIVLPNINDGFKGIAPDLGAIETGEPVPVYGARGIGNQPFYR